MKTAFVTGANRGIGFSICEILLTKYNFDIVYLGCRNADRAKEAVEKLKHLGKAIPIIIDIENEDSIKQAYNSYLSIREENEGLDLLVNNAAMNIDWIPNKWYPNVFEIPTSDVERNFRVNMMGAFLVTKHFKDVIKDYGSVVNVGTGALELANPLSDQPEYPFYSAAKLAAFMLTKKMGAALKSRHISVNMACPGWCKTGMGGELATDGPEIGANSILEAAFIGKKIKPTGKFMRFGAVIPIDTYAVQKQSHQNRLDKVKKTCKLIYFKTKGL